MTTTRRKFTKALLVRLSAVGLFICLGTFAVMHSLQSTADPENPEPESAEIAENSTADSPTDLSETNQPDAASAILPFQVPANTNSTAATDQRSPVPGFSSRSGGSFSLGSNSAPPSGKTTEQPATSFPPSSPNSLSGSGRSLLPPIRQTANPETGNAPAGKPPGQPDRDGGLIPPLVNNRQGKQPDSDSTLPPWKSAPPAATPATAQSEPATDDSRFPPLRPRQLAGNDIRSPATMTNAGFRSQPGDDAASEDSAMGQPPAAPPTRPADVGPPPATFASRANGPGGFPADPGKPAASPPQDDSESDRWADQGPSPGAARPGTQPPVATSPDNPLANTANGFAAGSSSPASSRPETQFGESSSSSRVPANPAAATPATTGPVTRTPVPATSLVAAPMGRSGNAKGADDTASAASPVPGEPRFEGVQIPALAVQKIAPREVQVNREAIFELIVKNTGRSSAEHVQVHDYVPEGARLMEAVPAPSQNSDGRIRWDLGTLNPGQQVSIRMKLMPERPGNLGSVAQVTFGAQASAKTICTQPKLNIRHEAPESVLIGQNILLNIFVENLGDGAAENVVLQEDVPEGLEFPGGQRELEYPIGTLQPGETRQVQLRLRAAQVGQVRNVLVAHGAGQLQADDVVSLRIVAPQLSVESAGPSRKFLNRSATHTFSVSNQGTAPATNMQLVARLPQGLKFASANNQGQYDRAGHAVVWRLAKLDAGKKGSVELTTIPVATGNYQIQIEARSDLNQQQQTTQSMVVEQLSELFFDIDDTADAIEVGTGTTYRIRVINQGQIPATNVQVQVDFAEAIQPVSVEGALRHEIRNRSVVLDPIPTLAPGQELAFVIEANALAAGDHQTVVSVRSDDREIAISKEESTHVYADR